MGKPLLSGNQYCLEILRTTAEAEKCIYPTATATKTVLSRDKEVSSEYSDTNDCFQRIVFSESKLLQHAVLVK